MLAGACTAIAQQSASPGAAEKPRNGATGAASGASFDPVKIFRAGQDALNQGRLDDAERDFRKIITQDPRQGGAYANLGVVYMRRKQWEKALDSLRKAERHLGRQRSGCGDVFECVERNASQYNPP